MLWARCGDADDADLRTPGKNKGLAEAKPKFLLVGRVGIEPTTNGLRVG